MLVEDDPAVRFANAQTLKLAGLEVETCASAEAALEKLHPLFPGILLVDVRLPGMDGLETLARIQEIPFADRPEVVIISGHGTIEIAVGAIQQGAYDFVEKPFQTDRLLVIVQRALEATRVADRGCRGRQCHAVASASWRR